MLTLIQILKPIQMSTRTRTLKPILNDSEVETDSDVETDSEVDTDSDTETDSDVETDSEIDDDSDVDRLRRLKLIRKQNRLGC